MSNNSLNNPLKRRVRFYGCTPIPRTKSQTGRVIRLNSVVIKAPRETVSGFVLYAAAIIVAFAATGIAFRIINTSLNVSSTGMKSVSPIAIKGDIAMRITTKTRNFCHSAVAEFHFGKLHA